MKRHFLKQYWRPVRLLLAACTSTVILIAVGVPLQAEESPGARARFVELDRELQAIKEEILAVNRDILLLEDLSLYPRGTQLVVLVSIASGNTGSPERITLQLDGKTVKQHDYSHGERVSLRKGGVHRLYTARLSEGEHRLDVSVSRRQAGDKTFKQQLSVGFAKGPGRKYMELQLGQGEQASQPGLSIAEWQQ